MSIPGDPLLAQQWHLHNPTGGLLDLNVFGVWNPDQGQSYNGAGTRTVVIDNGVDYNHPDLAPHYSTRVDYDFSDGDADPLGVASDAHGTAVAGLIGAAANGIGGVGVAYGTDLVGYRTYGIISNFWLFNVIDAIHDAAVVAHGDVANISQGIANDYISEFGVGYNPGRFDEIEASIRLAVDQGRGGLGMTIVKSAGNSRGDLYDVNADDWTNDTRQVVVAAVNQNGGVSSYSSYGSAILVSGFGTPGQVLTTDRTGSAGYVNGDYFNGFNGTSAAAPMVAGIVCLIYEANPDLGWRDVQSILAASARHVGSSFGSAPSGSERYAWTWNGADTWNGGGQHYSNDYGYGLVDGLAAVRMAETWFATGTDAAITANQATSIMDVLNGAVVVPDGNPAGRTFGGSADANDIVDRVTVAMTFSTRSTGDLDLFLTSPSGTVSQLVDNAGQSNDFNGTWTFETQAFRGERAAGTWSVRAVDADGGDTISISDIVITTFGSAGTGDRYLFTNEYSNYAGLTGHARTISDTNGGNDTISAAAVGSASTIRLDGSAGLIDGVGVSFSGIENAIGGDGNDIIIGNIGANQLIGMRGDDTLNGYGGNDILDGGDGNDRLNGQNGNDEIHGGSGFDAMIGGAGTDTMTGGSGNDRFNGGGGGDVLFGGLGLDEMLGGGGNDLLSGHRGRDILDGQGGLDTLRGGGGNDMLAGGAGIDRLYGGDGADTLTGGAGVDTFYFSAVSESPLGAFDTVTSFDNPGASAGDLFNLSAIDGNVAADGNQRFDFGGSQGAGALAKGAGFLWFTNDAGDTYLNANNDARADVDFRVLIEDGVVVASAYSANDVIL
jgi:subtilisin-like proprotein convertase family protein